MKPFLNSVYVNFIFHLTTVLQQIFNIIENLLAEHDVELLQRFVEIGATVKIYAWPLLQNMFSDVFAEADWLRVWDNIISNHPGFIIFVAIAYLKVARVCFIWCFFMLFLATAFAHLCVKILILKFHHAPYTNKFLMYIRPNGQMLNRLHYFIVNL